MSANVAMAYVPNDNASSHASTSNSTSDLSPRKRKLPPPYIQQQQRPAKRYRGCSKIEEYEKSYVVGEGTFGEVSKARCKATGRTVALKRILTVNEKEGVPITALREIKILKSLRHDNIVDVVDIAVKRGNPTQKQPGFIYMVFPYMEHDLTGLLENPSVRFTDAQIKSYVKQLLEGIFTLHKNNIMHRDIKGANLLINNRGVLKIADFGLARPFEEDSDRKLTNCVVTRWYRPPELLLGDTKYTTSVDMWGVGCVIGEMFKRKPILPGKSDLDQLDKIFHLCGAPDEKDWPSWRQLPSCDLIRNFGRNYHRTLRQRFGMFDPKLVDLLDQLLQLNPKNRLSANDALDHAWLWTAPLPAQGQNMPHFNDESHELDSRRKRDLPGPHDRRPQPQHHSHQSQQHNRYGGNRGSQPNNSQQPFHRGHNQTNGRYDRGWSAPDRPPGEMAKGDHWKSHQAPKDAKNPDNKAGSKTENRPNNTKGAVPLPVEGEVQSNVKSEPQASQRPPTDGTAYKSPPKVTPRDKQQSGEGQPGLVKAEERSTSSDRKHEETSSTASAMDVDIKTETNQNRDVPPLSEQHPQSDPMTSSNADRYRNPDRDRRREGPRNNRHNDSSQNRGGFREGRDRSDDRDSGRHSNDRFRDRDGRDSYRDQWERGRQSERGRRSDRRDGGGSSSHGGPKGGVFTDYGASGLPAYWTAAGNMDARPPPPAAAIIDGYYAYPAPPGHPIGIAAANAGPYAIATASFQYGQPTLVVAQPPPQHMPRVQHGQRNNHNHRASNRRRSGGSRPSSYEPHNRSPRSGGQSGQSPTSGGPGSRGGSVRAPQRTASSQ